MKHLRERQAWDVGGKENTAVNLHAHMEGIVSLEKPV